MIRPLLAAVLLLLPAAAGAAERRITIGSFDRLRVTGTFEVSVTTGGAPGATVIADPGVIGDIELRVEGNTLTIRRAQAGTWSQQGNQQGRAAATPVRVLVSTPSLAAITVTGGSRVAATQMKASRIDLAAAGTGAIAVAGSASDQLTAQLIGDGRIAVAGRTGTARLLANGAGSIDAAGLEASDLTARLDGLGAIAARARYTAQVTSTGLGTVSVAGHPKCRVTAAAGAPVTCGD